MTRTKIMALAAVALLAATTPMSVSQDAPGGLYRITTSCASATESSVGVPDDDFGNSGCEPAWRYVCTTPTKDYTDKRPI